VDFTLAFTENESVHAGGISLARLEL
jgi:hypothetical protein